MIGVFTHFTVLNLPAFLYRRWNTECQQYLTSINHPINPLIQPYKNTPWRTYLPLCYLPLLTLDILLFSSSFIILYHFSNDIARISALIFTWLLLATSYIDFEHHILPDEITYTVLWLGLLLSKWNIYIDSGMAIMSSVIAYVALWLAAHLFTWLRKKEGLGQGDIKLFSALAAWVGVFNLPLVLLIAALSSIIFIILRKLFWHRPVSAAAAFGPFLAFAAWITLLWGDVMGALLIR